MSKCDELARRAVTLCDEHATFERVSQDYSGALEDCRPHFEQFRDDLREALDECPAYQLAILSDFFVENSRREILTGADPSPNSLVESLRRYEGYSNDSFSILKMRGKDYLDRRSEAREGRIHNPLLGFSPATDGRREYYERLAGTVFLLLGLCVGGKNWRASVPLIILGSVLLLDTIFGIPPLSFSGSLLNQSYEWARYGVRPDWQERKYAESFTLD